VSRMPRPYVAFGFASVHDSLEAESALAKVGVLSLAIPSPRELGELCGIALRLEPADMQAALAALETAGMRPVATADISDI